MADDLKRVGLVFKADGAIDFKKSVQEVNSSIQENRTAFKLAQSQWDENTETAEKLATKQKYLSEQTKDYSDKVKLLQRELKELEEAEKRDEDAINKKRNQLNQAKTSLNNYQKGLSAVEKELKNGAYKIQEYTDKIDKFSEKAEKVGDKLSGVSTAAAGVLAGAAAMVPATEEYRKIMASLEVSSELANYTAEQTKETYTQLFGVLGDDQSAATTTANLQALGIEQEKLNSLTNSVIGAWAKYGDSIPIDGLAEAVNETVKAGQVTGNFADVLNWGAKEGETFGVKLKASTEANKEWNNAVMSAATAEDYFNLALQECTNETERTNLVMQFMAEQGLTEAGKKWQENNKNLVEGNKASAELQEQTAELAETIAPIVTDITELMTGLLEGFNNLPSGMQTTIGVVLILVASLSMIFSTIGKVSTGVSALTKILGTATTGTLGFNAAWLACPITWIIVGIVALIAIIVTLYNKCEWFRDGVDGIVDKIGEKFGELGSFFSGLGKKIKETWEKIKKSIKLPHFKISGDFSLSPPSTPKLSVDWYAKGAILNRPTIFGLNGDRLMGGGEAGAEAVLPIALLRKYINEENQANNSILATMIKEAISEMQIMAENNIYIGDRKFYDVITEMVIKKISSGVNDKRMAKGLV